MPEELTAEPTELPEPELFARGPLRLGSSHQWHDGARAVTTPRH